MSNKIEFTKEVVDGMMDRLSDVFPGFFLSRIDIVPLIENVMYAATGKDAQRLKETSKGASIPQMAETSVLLLTNEQMQCLAKMVGDHYRKNHFQKDFQSIFYEFTKTSKLLPDELIASIKANGGKNNG